MLEKEEWRRMIIGTFEEVRGESTLAPEGCKILKELDRGGMAIIYLAQQLEPLREVALKVILPRYADDEKARERFKQEGRAMAALEHPGVLPVHQIGEWDGLPFIMMKLARGGTLQALLKERQPDFEEVMKWSIAAGEAVEFAHQRGVWHRDLKPGNLLFDEEGKIYVGDFGVAKLEFTQDGGLTQTNMLVGTPNYLAPEVASGKSGGGSVTTDVYGMGAILYECLTGQRPHEGAAATNLAAQLRMVIEDELVPVQKIRPEVPSDLAMICEKALAKNPEERYETMAGFVDDLRRYQEGRKILARSPGSRERIWRSIKRHPLQAAFGAFFVLLACLAGAHFLPLSDGREAKATALAEEDPSVTITMTGSNQSWLNPDVWSDGFPPSPKNDYFLSEAERGFLRSSPIDSLHAGAADFPGKSLTVPANTRLLIKQIKFQTASINSGSGNLILDGGVIHFGPGGDDGIFRSSSDEACPVLSLNELRVTSALGSTIELNHHMRRAFIDGPLTGPGDILLNAEEGRSTSGAMVAFAEVDEDGFTGMITVDGGLILDFDSEVRFAGGVKIQGDSQLNVDQVLTFATGKLIDSANGVVPPGAYRGASLATLGEHYVDGGGAIVVEP